ncbi:MAG: polysaccharide biosynthesis protein, partial [Deltaproteobacteria bacterium]|nr:polysaccharide biosynthesis protein [Deltaproteobacteria bacterium]
MNFITSISRMPLTFAFQALLVVLAFNIAIFLRHDGGFPALYVTNFSSLVLPLVLIKSVIFTKMNTLSRWWRYVSIYDLVTLVKANLIASTVYALFVFYGPSGFYKVSLATLILDGMVCFLITSGARVAVRLCREYINAARRAYSKGSENVLIVGSGSVGQSIARDIQQNQNLKWRIAGFVDQDEARVKQRFQGIPVISSIEDLSPNLKALDIKLVIIANPSLNQKELRELVEICHKNKVKSKILPNVSTILTGDVSVNHVRDVKFDDLLGRKPVELDVSNIKSYLLGKKVLVTGAAGSIGSEICRQVSHYGADTLILFDSAETPLFDIERELQKKHPTTNFIARLNDVRDSWQVDHIFNTYRPDVVFHAAAYKHVSMSENNPLTAISNNVLGTRILANAADRYNVKHFVMVSTDKAVNPTNIMGASKRAAEVYVQALAKKSQTKMVTVRFGNVLGSNGSVVPIFQQQIRNGGPVTVTDANVTRYFMTIPEAVQLVLQAGSMGHGGEIFVLDMGEQIKITHLAEELIRLSGMTPYQDIEIVFTGLRPGEKMHEELLHDSEGVLKTSHEKICVANSRSHNFEELENQLDELHIACRTANLKEALGIVFSIVPENRC